MSSEPGVGSRLLQCPLPRQKRDEGDGGERRGKKEIAHDVFVVDAAVRAETGRVRCETKTEHLKNTRACNGSAPPPCLLRFQSSSSDNQLETHTLGDSHLERGGA